MSWARHILPSLINDVLALTSIIFFVPRVAKPAKAKQFACCRRKPTIPNEPSSETIDGEVDEGPELRGYSAIGYGQKMHRPRHRLPTGRLGTGVPSAMSPSDSFDLIVPNPSSAARRSAMLLLAENHDRIGTTLQALKPWKVHGRSDRHCRPACVEARGHGLFCLEAARK